MRRRWRGGGLSDDDGGVWQGLCVEINAAMCVFCLLLKPMACMPPLPLLSSMQPVNAAVCDCMLLKLMDWVG